MCLHQPLPFNDSSLLPGRKGTLLPTLAHHVAPPVSSLKCKVREGIW